MCDASGESVVQHTYVDMSDAVDITPEKLGMHDIVAYSRGTEYLHCIPLNWHCLRQ
jgi:hypothetical protein